MFTVISSDGFVVLWLCFVLSPFIYLLCSVFVFDMLCLFELLTTCIQIEIPNQLRYICHFNLFWMTMYQIV